MASPNPKGGGKPFADDPRDAPAVRGYLHEPGKSNGQGLVLTHGAGGTCDAPLLVAIAGVFADAGFAVLRCNLPFRQDRPKGPPRPSDAARDREGLRAAVAALRAAAGGTMFLGGQSYGGRQATMLCAEDSSAAAGLLLLSYPLHAPQAPDKKRTEHLPRLGVPALFVHGTRDPFGTPDEMKDALRLIPTPTSLLLVDGAAHSLSPPRSAGIAPSDVAVSILHGFRELFTARRA